MEHPRKFIEGVLWHTCDVRWPWPWQSPPFSGGSASELSVTGACLIAAAGDWRNLRQFAATVCIELLTWGGTRGATTMVALGRGCCQQGNRKCYGVLGHRRAPVVALVASRRHQRPVAAHSLIRLLWTKATAPRQLVGHRTDRAVLGNVFCAGRLAGAGSPALDMHPGEPPSAPHGERRLERSRASPVFGWHNLTCHIMAIIALVRDQPRLLIEGVNAHDLAHGAMATRTPDSSSLLSKGRHAL